MEAKANTSTSVPHTPDESMELVEISHLPAICDTDTKLAVILLKLLLWTDAHKSR